MAHTWSGWENDVLKVGGWPTTEGNRGFLSRWASKEGGVAENNPLNTKRTGYGGSDHPGFTGDAAGVKDYPSHSAGAQATAGALTNGYYPRIVAFLATGKGDYENKDVAAAIAPEVRVWGSTTFADELDFWASGAKPTGTLGLPGPFSVLDPIADVVSATVAVAKMLVWLLQPKHWLQMIEVLAGAVLILLGMKHLVDAFSRANPVRRAVRSAAALAGKAKP